MTSYHTIVIGLGAMGSATAYHLARRGVRVLGLERFTPAHDRGSSHGESRILRLAYFEDPAYVPLLRRATHLWHALSAEQQQQHGFQAAEQEIIRVTGALMVGEAGATRVVHGARRSAETHALPHEMLSAAAVRARFPQFRVPDGALALYEPGGAVLFPEAAIRAHLHGAAAAGTELRFREPVTRWEADASGEGVRVTTAEGSYTARRLVIAAGAYAPPLLGAGAGVPLKLQRNVLYWFEAAEARRELFAPSRCPVFIWETAGGRSTYGFPEVAGGGRRHGVKVAYHGWGPAVAAPEALERRVSAEEVADMRAFTAARLPDIARGRLVGATACMYTLTPDHHFVLGAHPRHAAVLVCSPCSGHGFKMASVIGEVMADLAETGTTAHPIHPFRPTRFEEGVGVGGGGL